MPNEIILGLISAASSLAGALLGVIATSKLTNYRLEQLEKKVDRLSDNEQRLALLEQRMAMYEKEKKN